MDKYQNAHIADLAAQLKRGPRRLRLKQLLGIEFLLSVIEPGRSYPFDFVRLAITGYRPSRADDNPSRLAEAEPLVRDLVLLAEDLSEDADLPLLDWFEPVHTVTELAERFDVSTKTIFRWRRRGLTGWRVHIEDQRPKLVFPDRCVRRFVARNAELVSRGSSFSQLSKREREQIIAHAQQLVENGEKTVNAVAKTIATETNRAVETIRLILKNHDAANPRTGVFNRSPLQVESDDQRLAVWEAYVDGARIEALADRFGQPIAWIYRSITQMRARDMQSRPVEFVDSPEFAEPDADSRILHPAPSEPLRQDSSAGKRVPNGLPPYLASLFQVPLLTRAGEQHLFRKMNYLKYKAQQRLESLDPDNATASELDAIESLVDQAGEVKNEIVQANLRLVVSIAKRHMSLDHDLFELISDGNVSLMRAVDKFDYSRGFKFSTYASWAIMKNFARSIPESRRRRERYQTGWDELLDSISSFSPDDAESDELSVVRSTLDRMLGTLDNREGMILRRRFGLAGHGQPQTLEQIGQHFGVSKERVRQLESRAIKKLRVDFEDDVRQLLGA